MLGVLGQIASILLHFIFGFVDGAYGWDDFGLLCVFSFCGAGKGLVRFGVAGALLLEWFVGLAILRLRRL